MADGRRKVPDIIHYQPLRPIAGRDPVLLPRIVRVIAVQVHSIATAEGSVRLKIRERTGPGVSGRKLQSVRELLSEERLEAVIFHVSIGSRLLQSARSESEERNTQRNICSAVGGDSINRLSGGRQFGHVNLTARVDQMNAVRPYVSR